MEYKESTGYYVDTERRVVTLYTAWYEITPFRDGLIRTFLVPGSLREIKLSFSAFYQTLYILLSVEIAKPSFEQVA